MTNEHDLDYNDPTSNDPELNWLAGITERAKPAPGTKHKPQTKKGANQMSFIETNLGDVIEPTTLAEGSEAELRIVSAKCDNDKNGNPYLLVRFEVPAEAASKEFTKFFSLPRSDMSPKKLNQTKWSLKQFFTAFDISADHGFDPDSLIGASGWAILGVENNEEYGDSNYIKKFVIGA